MARPVNFGKQNRILRAAVGEEETVQALPAHIFQDADGHIICISCWQLDDTELEHIAKDGVVWLWTASQSPNPAMVSGITPFTERGPEVVRPYLSIGSGYEEIEQLLKNLPMTWYPALLGTMVREVSLAGSFQQDKEDVDVGIVNFVRNRYCAYLAEKEDG